MDEEPLGDGDTARLPRGSLDRFSDEGALVFSYLAGRDLAHAVIAWPREQVARATTLMLRQGADAGAVASALHFLPQTSARRSARWLLDTIGRGYGPAHYLPPAYHVATAQRGPFHSTTAHEAAAQNRPDLIRALAASGLPPDVLTRRDVMNLRPADIASQNGHAEVVDALLQAGVPAAEFISPAARQPLGCAGLAVLGNHGNVIAVMSRGGVDLTTQDADGFTLTQLAAQANRPAMIESLGLAFRQRGLPLSTLMAVNRQGHHAATIAALLDFPEVIRALLRAGVSPIELMAPGPHRSTCLHLAAERGHAEVVAVLAPLVDVNTRDAQGWAAIHLAAQSGQAVVTRILCDAGAQVNAAGPRGVTAAHLAVQGGHLDAVGALSAAEASFDLPDFDGRTPRAMALTRGWPQTSLPDRPRSPDVPPCQLM